MMIGFYAMIGKKNLVKKIIGINIFQTAIILFFVSTAAKRGGTLPIVEHAGHSCYGKYLGSGAGDTDTDLSKIQYVRGR